MKWRKKSVDDAVLDLLRKVQQKKDEIAKASRKPAWKTNCSIGFTNGFDAENKSDKIADRVNIVTVTDINRLAHIYMFVVQKEEALQRASVDLGVNLDMVYQGYPFDAWKDDLKARAGQLGIEQKKRELDELDSRVNKLVSPDQRREMELKALQELLGDEDDN